MTQPNKPCKNCGHPIYTDGEDFWKWDPATEQYRMVDYWGEFYPEVTHPGATEQRIVEYYGKELKLATDADILWRAVRLIVEGLRMANLM